MPKGQPLVGLSSEEKRARHVAKTKEALKRRLAAMMPEEREAYRARTRRYTAKWQSQNRERVNEKARETMRRIRAENPGMNAAQCRASYRRHREERRAAAKERWPEIRDAKNKKRRAHYYEHRDDANAARRENMQKRRKTHPWAKFLQSARQRAAKKGVPFELTPEWAAARWTGRCEITDLPFTLGRTQPGPSFWSPSIDRIIPALGYTPTNSRFALWAVNALKHDGTDEDMIAVARAIAARYPLTLDD